MKRDQDRQVDVDQPAQVSHRLRAPIEEQARTKSAAIATLQRSAGNRAVATLLSIPQTTKRLSPIAPKAPAVSPEQLIGVTAPGAVVQRDGPITKAAEQTGIKIEPGPIRSGGRSTFALPTSVNVLKRPASGQGRWLTAPSFSLRLDPRGMVAGMLDQVTLGGMQLTNPTLVFNAGSNSVTAVGTVSIPTKYPGLDSPTNIQVTVRSSGLSRFEAEGTTSLFFADLTLDLAYDAEPLNRMINAARSGVHAAAAATIPDTDRPARFGISGTAGIGVPGGKLPLNYLRGSGTVDPSGLSAWGGAVGAIGLPQGTFRSDMPVPAGGSRLRGAKVGSGGAMTGGYGFAGITGTPSISDLVTGNLSRAFSPFAYAQVIAAHKTADGHRFTVKISAQSQLGSDTVSRSPVEPIRDDLDARRQGERYHQRSDNDPKRSDIDPGLVSERKSMEAPPAIGSGGMITLTGTFDLLGGK